MKHLDRRLRRLEEAEPARDVPTGARLADLHRRVIAAEPSLAGRVSPADVAGRWDWAVRVVAELERLRRERAARWGRVLGPEPDNEERAVALLAVLFARRLERMEVSNGKDF